MPASPFKGALQRLLAASAAVVVTFLSWTSGPAHAQTSSSSCVPGASGALPVVNTGLPVVQIWTTARAPILDREHDVGACLRIRDGSVQTYRQGLFTGTLKVRGEGTFSWDSPKRSLRLRLDAAAPVLDMPAHRDWVLLANYADKTLLRNDVAMELGRRVGLAWTPRLRHVALYLNDEFLGDYLLGESVGVGPQRVAITPMVPTDLGLPPLSGGYLIEAEYPDYIAPGERSFATSEGIRFVLHSPSGSSVQPVQADYIQRYTQTLETLILSGNSDPTLGWPALLDLDSAVNWYLVEELMKNVDAPFGSSVYLYKDREARMKMGPLWEFDLSAGNVDFEPLAMQPGGWYVRKRSAWFQALLNDKTFRNRVKTRWSEVRSRVGSIDAYIAGMETQLLYSQAENFKRWPILDTWVWPNAVVLGSHHAEVAWLSDWLRKRIQWMDNNVGK